MSIASWTDPTGATHWADTESKAYRDRVQAEPAQASQDPEGEAFIPLAEPKRSRSAEPKQLAPKAETD